MRLLSLAFLASGLAWFGLGLATAMKPTCYQQGPFPAEQVIPESATAREAISLWPLGRTCQWFSRDGDQLGAAQSGSVAESMAIATLLGAGAAGVWMTSTRLATPTTGDPPR